MAAFVPFCFLLAICFAQAKYLSRSSHSKLHRNFDRRRLNLESDILRDLGKRVLIKSDSTVTSDIDKETRKEILFLIINKINITVTSQTQSIRQCEVALNNTADSCTACRQNMCGALAPPLHEALLGTIGTGLNYPIVYAGLAVEEIGKWFGSSPDWMGSRAREFSSTIGSTANNVGSKLKDTGIAALSFLGDNFSDLGSKFTSAVNSIKDGMSNLDDLFGNAFSKFESGFKNFVFNVGNDISNGATNLWESTLGKWLKRSCTTSCPDCDDLNTDTYTTDEITEKVCGSETVTSKNQAISDLTFLKGLYNTTITEILVTEIEFESSSLDFSGGTAAFSESYYTADGIYTAFQGVFDPAKKEDTGKAIAAEYFVKVWINRATAITKRTHSSFY